MPDNTIKIFHLEMRDQSDFTPKEGSADFTTTLVKPADSKLNQQLYREVGAKWQWTDRLPWSDQEWRDYVARDNLTTWLAHWKGERAGYFELEAQHNGNVEIVYFGLLPNYIGNGLGSMMLTAAVKAAWNQPDTQRVWVHTCSNDHRHALENYRKRGFRLFKTESE